MRQKIDDHVSKDEIKHAPGGLLDLEFLIQFLILSHPSKSVVKETNTLEQIKGLYKAQVLTKAQQNDLMQAYAIFHKALHQSLLESKQPNVAKAKRLVTQVSKTFL
jgi:[glutamine synthetase] adenylyltransferase / [glutamine synthetase]-adenylyl-L-tyrosine phosphorylase